jgi:hypothetical protein
MFDRAPVIPETLLSAVIQVFPWINGITLQQGDMTDTLTMLWDSSERHYPGIHSSLLLVRAPFPSFWFHSGR